MLRTSMPWFRLRSVAAPLDPWKDALISCTRPVRPPSSDPRALRVASSELTYTAGIDWEGVRRMRQEWRTG